MKLPGIGQAETISGAAIDVLDDILKVGGVQKAPQTVEELYEVVKQVASYAVGQDDILLQAVGANFKYTTFALLAGGVVGISLSTLTIALISRHNNK